MLIRGVNLGGYQSDVFFLILLHGDLGASLPKYSSVSIILGLLDLNDYHK